jgi:peptidoglycan biosynthesis protein MviN/MurJ (putative lipid II flippase)
MYDPNNQFEPGTAEYYTKKVANEAQERNAARMEASGPMTFARSLAPAIFWCGLFAVAIFGSTSAFKSTGHIVLIAGGALLALVIAFVGYNLLVRPTARLASRGWRSNIVVRSVMVGAAVGIGLGAWLDYSMHEFGQGFIRVGVIGAVLGLIVGAILRVCARASKQRDS